MKEGESSFEEKQLLRFRGTLGWNQAWSTCNANFKPGNITCEVKTDSIIGDIMCVEWNPKSAAWKMEGVSRPISYQPLDES